MASKKHTKRVAPHISSAAALSASTSTYQANASVIQKAAFAPSVFQLSLFASVIQALNGYQVRIHDTVSGHLQCQHDANATRVTSLDWGYFGDAAHLLERQYPKKKRRLEETNGIKAAPGDIVVALGTNLSEIQMFSPANAKVIASLKSRHKSGVKTFKFTNFGIDGEGWSLGAADKKLVQWNLRDQTAVRTIEHHVSHPSTIFPLKSALLVSSHDTWLLDLEDNNATSQVGNGANVIHTICVDIPPSSDSKPNRFLTAAQDERQIFVYDLSGKAPSLLTLNATSDIEAVTMPAIPNQSAGHRAAEETRPLAAITKQGELELFTDPFQPASLANGTSGRKSKQERTRPSHATVKIVHSGPNQDPLPLVGASFLEDELVLAYVESGGHVAFERMPWRDSETYQLLLNGTIIIEKEKTVIGAGNENRVGAKLVGRVQLDESNAVVSYGVEDDANVMAVNEAEPITISSAEEDESASDDDEDLPNGTDVAMADDHGSRSYKAEDGLDEESQLAADAEPTFGDLLRSNASGLIDVAASLPNHQDQTIVPYGREGSKASGLTLTNVLSQALRTNDVSLLESCFHEQDLNVVRATIERLDSALATALLQKLAEKLHSRPGRAGSLMIWIQWTLVAHGGFLGSQPDTVKRLAALQRVVKERANSLQPLLSLKGKLDMLEAQMNLRRSVLGRHRRESQSGDEEDASIVYVEGQDDSDEEASSSDESNVGDEDEEEDEQVGFDQASEGSDVDVSDATDEASSGLLDEEASETGESDEEDLNDEVDYEDVDSADEVSEEDGAAFSGKSKLPNGIR